jgi:hypothetical protein
MKEYELALEKAGADYEAAMQERRALDAKILHLRQTVATLMRLIGRDLPHNLASPGITDATRVYLRYIKTDQEGRPVTVQELRHQLEIVGFDFTDYRNPNASISGTLQKLVEADEVKKVRFKRDGTFVAAYVATDKIKDVQFAGVPMSELEAADEAGKEAKKQK